MKVYSLQFFASSVFAQTCQRLGCKRGYELKNGECFDIDECANSPCDAKADCFNTAGSFICNCRKGFEGTGFQCEPYKVSLNQGSSL